MFVGTNGPFFLKATLEKKYGDPRSLGVSLSLIL